MLVYDYVIYDGEPIIEFRLKYLNEYVDKFIIVESIYTFSGNETVCDVDEIPNKELYINIKNNYNLLHNGAHIQMLF